MIDFPYYVSDNLEKIYFDKKMDTMEIANLMDLFNSYFILENNGTKGAIKFLLKSLEKDALLELDGPLYKSYLLTIIKNNERSLPKACSLLIQNEKTIALDSAEILMIHQMLEKHLLYEHDLEVIWLLYLLIETNNMKTGDDIIKQIIKSKNELAKIMLLNKNIISNEEISQIIDTSFSWILIYELFVSNKLNEEQFITKLNIIKNIKMYKDFKDNNIHFCKFDGI